MVCVQLLSRASFFPPAHQVQMAGYVLSSFSLVIKGCFCLNNWYVCCAAELQPLSYLYSYFPNIHASVIKARVSGKACSCNHVQVNGL